MYEDIYYNIINGLEEREMTESSRKKKKKKLKSHQLW